MTILNNIYTIIKAETGDSSVLSQISFAAKRHWPYPDSYFELWKDELTIKENYLVENIVFKAISGNNILGFYSVTENKADFYNGEVFVPQGYWLEHLFVRPEHHRMGIGSALINHARHKSKEMGIRKLFIFVDPYAKGFYDTIGAEYQYDSKSSVPGRFIPVYVLKT